MAVPEWQANWRSGAVASVTAHLSDEDVATLDQIAIILCERPVSPDEPTIFPGRPAAIRWLCAQYRREHGPPPKRLKQLRDELADFWRCEASRRREIEGMLRRGEPVPPPAAGPWRKRK